MPPPPERDILRPRPAAAIARIPRFDRTERWVHRATAALFAVCMVTAACLYLGPLSVLVGRRELVRTFHVWSGLALPLPVIVGWVGRQWGAALRDDLSRLGRFAPADWRWLRARGHDPAARPGKFNAGQKLNTAFVGGTIVVMMMSGAIMHWFNPFPDSWRTGATFVHDWLALAATVVILGHITLARRYPESGRGLRTGSVSADYARSHHPAWYDEVTGGDEPAA